jgi:hypothetical protein
LNHASSSLRAISEMEQAICRPAQYLGRLPGLLRAVNAVALAHSLDRDSGWVAAKRGGNVTTPAARSSRKGCALAGRRCSRVCWDSSGVYHGRRSSEGSVA